MFGFKTNSQERVGVGLLLASSRWTLGMLLCCSAPLNAQARPPYKPSTLWPQMFTGVTVEKSRLSGTRAVSLSRPLIPTSSLTSLPTSLWYKGRSVVSVACWLKCVISVRARLFPREECGEQALHGCVVPSPPGPPALLHEPHPGPVHLPLSSFLHSVLRKERCVNTLLRGCEYSANISFLPALNILLR